MVRRDFPDGATPAQLDAWPAIAQRRHALIAAPTGSGKTLAAFLAAIDSLVREGAAGRLRDVTRVVYVSPLKALSNDIQRNLEAPLAGISAELIRPGLHAPQIRAQVRTGDTSQTERAAMRRLPPHILVTTPESLYLLLTSVSGREMLTTVRTVIVDEIHAVAQTKRGAHLSLTLERLAANAAQPMQRIGLSATQKPIEEVARFLVGRSGAGQQVRVAPATGCPMRLPRHHSHRQHAARARARPQPGDADGAARGGDVRAKSGRRSTTSSRSSSRNTTPRWSSRTPAAWSSACRATSPSGWASRRVAAHHGSLSKETRFDAEQRLKAGSLKVMVATASLELGIDIGDVELVCQLGSPRSISVFLQRVGRANHSVSGVPKGRIFPASRDELVDCTALLDAVRRGELDRLRIPEHPLDVLSQQIVAEVAAREYGEDELFALMRRAYPYRNLERKDFDAVVRMLAGRHQHQARPARHLPASRRGQQGAARRARARGSRPSPAAAPFPDNADYQVILEPAGIFVGTLNEDFAIESLAGDIFQLGNTSYRILRVEAGRVRVEDAKGQPPSIPFWLGEAPARTDELSASVSRLRADIEALLPEVTSETHRARHRHASQRATSCRAPAARQLVDYLARRQGRARQTTHAATRWCSSVSSTSPAACSSSSTRRSARA